MNNEIVQQTDVTQARQLSFEEKVKSMTGSEILNAMIKGITKKHVAIDMNTYGTWKYKGDSLDIDDAICIGCAATNAICEISGIKFTPKTIYGRGSRAETLNTQLTFLTYFEDAIDSLRCGLVDNYNNYASIGGFAFIKLNKEGQDVLPILNDDFTKEELKPYRQLARYNHRLERVAKGGKW